MSDCHFGISPVNYPDRALLFVIFINDIDNVVRSTRLKFADVCKVYRILKTPQDIGILQEDVVDLCDWSDHWEMLFNVKKCKLLHYGFNDPIHPYTMNDEKLTSDTSEKDLGVYITIDLKSAKTLCGIRKKSKSSSWYDQKTLCIKGQKNYHTVIPEDHWSCIAHLIAEDVLKSAVIEEKKFKNIECK